jgi:hypothetical protein
VRLIWPAIPARDRRKVIRYYRENNWEKSPAFARGFFNRAHLGCVHQPAADRTFAMPKLSKKINAPVARKRSSIRLLDGHTTIKLPIAPNPVHMLQEFLKVELSKEESRNASRVEEVLGKGHRRSSGRG